MKTAFPLNEVNEQSVQAIDPLKEMELWDCGAGCISMPGGPYWTGPQDRAGVFVSEAAAWQFRRVNEVYEVGSDPCPISWDEAVEWTRDAGLTHIEIWGMDPYNPIDVVEVAGL